MTSLQHNIVWNLRSRGYWWQRPQGLCSLTIHSKWPGIQTQVKANSFSHSVTTPPQTQSLSIFDLTLLGDIKGFRRFYRLLCNALYVCCKTQYNFCYVFIIDVLHWFCLSTILLCWPRRLAACQESWTGSTSPWQMSKTIWRSEKTLRSTCNWLLWMCGFWL